MLSATPTQEIRKALTGGLIAWVIQIGILVAWILHSAHAGTAHAGASANALLSPTSQLAALPVQQPMQTLRADSP